MHVYVRIMHVQTYVHVYMDDVAYMLKAKSNKILGRPLISQYNQ